MSAPRAVRLERVVAPARGVALVVVGDFAVGADALLRLVAPEEAVVGVRNGGVPFRLHVHAFPAQVVAAVVVEFGERRTFTHGAPCEPFRPRRAGPA